MTRIFPQGLALLIVSACASVDVAPEVAAFSTSLGKAASAMEGDLSARAAGEEAAARAAAVASGDLIYVPPSACVLAASGAGAAGDCRLEPLVRAEVAPGSATAMLGYLNLLKAYAAALTTLATGTEPDASAKAFAGVVEAAESLAKVVPDTAEETKLISRTKPPLAKLTGRLAEAQRLRLIRTLVRDAGPGVTAALDRLIAYREASDGLAGGAEALTIAYDRLETARRSGDPAAYGAALADYEALHAALQQRLTGSDAGRLILIREAQGKLEARLGEPGDLDDYMGLIETLGALARAVEE